MTLSKCVYITHDNISFQKPYVNLSFLLIYFLFLYLSFIVCHIYNDDNDNRHWHAPNHFYIRTRKILSQRIWTETFTHEWILHIIFVFRRTIKWNEKKWLEVSDFIKLLDFSYPKIEKNSNPNSFPPECFHILATNSTKKKRKSFPWFINSFVLSLAHKNYAARLLLSYPISSTESKSQCRCHFRMYTRNTWNCSIEWFSAFFSVYFKH